MPLSIKSTITLRGGIEMPRFGLGTYKAEAGGEVEAAVQVALREGYRSIDTASLYENERAIGKAVDESEISREDLFITTKVWNDEQGYEETLAALHRSLERLGMDYVDLYLMHWPVPRLMEGTWRAMEELLGEGHVRAIGVCNFLETNLEQLETIASEMPAVNQFEFHPRLQQPELVAACRDRGIVVEAWAPIMRGRVGEVEEIASLASRYGKTPAQITLRWMVQKDVVTIPKSVHENRIIENASIFDFELEDEDMALMDSLDRGERIGRDPSWAATDGL